MARRINFYLVVVPKQLPLAPDNNEERGIERSKAWAEEMKQDIERHVENVSFVDIWLETDNTPEKRIEELENALALLREEYHRLSSEYHRRLGDAA